MTELEYLKERLAINENFVAAMASALKGTGDVALFNKINVAQGHAVLQFQALQEHYAKQQPQTSAITLEQA